MKQMLWILIAVLLLGLVGCGEGGAENGGDTTVTEGESGTQAALETEDSLVTGTVKDLFDEESAEIIIDGESCEVRVVSEVEKASADDFQEEAVQQYELSGEYTLTITNIMQGSATKTETGYTLSLNKLLLRMEIAGHNAENMQKLLLEQLKESAEYSMYVAAFGDGYDMTNVDGKTREATVEIAVVNGEIMPVSEKSVVNGALHYTVDYKDGVRLVKKSYHTNGSVSSQFEYDANGNCTRQTSYNDAGKLNQELLTEYNARGNVIKSENYINGELYQKHEYEYDEAGTLRRKCNWHNGETVIEEYNSEGQTTKTIRPGMANDPDGEAVKVMLTTEYDLENGGWKETIVFDQSGRTIVRYYDENGSEIGEEILVP